MNKKVFNASMVIGGILIGFSIIFYGVVYAADFHQNQKLNFTTNAQSEAQALLNLRAEAKKLTEAYYANGFQSGGAYEIVVGDFANSSFEGLTVAELTAVITSLEAFETFMATHAEIFKKITK